MADSVHKLPQTIVRAIIAENLPSDSTIFHQDDHGWVYRRRNTGLGNSSSSNLNNSQSLTSLVGQSLNNQARPLESLGPFGTQSTDISISIILGSDMYTTTFNPISTKFPQYEDNQGMGQHAPLTPITLDGTARDVSHIPRDATHFCWVYPPVGLTQLNDRAKKRIDKKVATGDASHTFFAFGGFVYFRLDGCNYTTLRANALVKADNGLVFQGPHQWRPTYTAHLARQGRFQSVTISSLMDLGIKYYCFINPNEQLHSSVESDTDWTPVQNGGFIYLYGSPLDPHPLDRYFSIADAPLSSQASAEVMPFSLVRHAPTRPSPLPRSDHAAIVRPSSSSSPSITATDRFQCSICFERTIQCILIPCKHMCACAECARTIKERLNSCCPICRQKFTEVWDVFL